MCTQPCLALITMFPRRNKAVCTVQHPDNISFFDRHFYVPAQTIVVGVVALSGVLDKLNHCIDHRCLPSPPPVLTAFVLIAHGGHPFSFPTARRFSSNLGISLTQSSGPSRCRRHDEKKAGNLKIPLRKAR